MSEFPLALIGYVPGIRRAGPSVKRTLWEPQPNSRLDLVGKRFGTVVVTAHHVRKNGHSHWRFICDCGRAGVGITKTVVTGVRQCACKLSEKNIRGWAARRARQQAEIQAYSTGQERDDGKTQGLRDDDHGETSGDCVDGR